MPPAGVDELLVQFDAGRQPWWVLSDAGGDVVAIAKRHGTGASAHARVAAQWTYDAYGAVVAAEVFDATSPVNRCGHKGLFADRLDVGVLDGLGGEEHERLAQGADLLYHNRNRTLSPRLGRFLQSDPNATGIAVVGRTNYAGVAFVTNKQFGLSLESHYGDGSNTYSYLQNNPILSTDPLGLYMWGGWDDTLATGAQVAGLAMAAVSTYQFVMEEGVEWATDWSRDDNEIHDFVSIAHSASMNIDAGVDEAAGAYQPMIANIFKSAKALATTAKALSGARRLYKIWLNKGPKNVDVYLKSGNYVGLSNSVARRAGQHGVGRDQMKVLAEGLTRNQARVVENYLIKKHRSKLTNKIQSISDNHRFASWAEQEAKSILPSIDDILIR